MRFTRDDLPTLGRPATTTIGRSCGAARGGTTCRRAPGAASARRSGPPRPAAAGRPGSARRGSGPRSGRRRAAGSGGPSGTPASARATSSPVSSPATPMLPPKKSFSHGAQRDVVAAVRRQQRCEHTGAVGAGEHDDRPLVAPGPVPSAEPRGPVALGRAPRRPAAKNPWRTPPGPPPRRRRRTR